MNSANQIVWSWDGEPFGASAPNEDLEGLEAGMNTYGYAAGNPVVFIDSQGLAAGGVKWLWTSPAPKMGSVTTCHRPVDVSWIPGGLNKVLPHHHWVKTSNAEAGMGGACPVPGQQCSDRPYSDTLVKDHTGQSTQPGAQCDPVGDDIDVECVDKLIKVGNPTGTWTVTNQCMTFAYETIAACRRKK